MASPDTLTPPQRLFHGALVVALLDRTPLVELLLSTGDAQEDLRVTPAEVHFQRDQRRAAAARGPAQFAAIASAGFLLQALDEPPDLPPVQKQTPGARGVVVELVGLNVLVNVAAHEKDLSVSNAREALAQLDLPLTHGLYLASDQGDAAFDLINDEEIKCGPAVLDARGELARVDAAGLFFRLAFPAGGGVLRTWDRFAHVMSIRAKGGYGP